jgi:hypothetical protein
MELVSYSYITFFTKIVLIKVAAIFKDLPI